MLETAIIVISILMALAGSALAKVYSQLGKKPKFSPQMPPKQQRALSFLAVHKATASFLLGVATALLLAIASSFLDEKLGFVGLLLSFLALLVVFWAIPRSKTPRLVKQLAFLSAPTLRACVEKILPFSQKALSVTSKFHEAKTDSGIYTRSDLKDFIRRQKRADNNTISNAELDGLVARLEFEDKRAKDLMEPRTKAKIVGASEQIGPVLINELHETGRQYFLVEEEFNNEIVGVLNVGELVDLKKTGDVKTAMYSQLFYLNEKNTLTECLGGFFKTGSSVFLVVGSDEDIVGLISIFDVIADLIGGEPAGDFNMYENREAVAEGQQDATGD